MKKQFFLLLVVLFSLTAHSQRVYFVYLQSENAQSFYTRIDEKVYNSSPSGYLILPKLRDTIYNLRIGFADGTVPEKLYSIKINKRDHGYLLKNFGDKGMGLFDLQNMSVLMPVIEHSTSMIRTEALESNHFTDLLSRASDDSTLKHKPVMVKAEVKPAETVVLVEKKPEPPTETKTETKLPQVDAISKVETKSEDKTTNTKLETKTPVVEEKADKKEPDVVTVSKKEDLTVPKKEDVTVPKKEDVTLTRKEEEKTKEVPVEPLQVEAIYKDPQPVIKNEVKVEKPAEEYRRSTILRRAESSTTEGFGLTFVDLLPGGESDTIRIIIPNQSTGFGSPGNPANVKKEEKRFIEMSENHSQQVNQEERIKTNCKAVASESDFFKLRKKMASASSDKSMLGEARKVFRTKCFTTLQIRNLSTLFLSDEGKYNFFGEAYAYVTDPGNFASLQSELTEEAFVNRFPLLMK